MTLKQLRHHTATCCHCDAISTGLHRAVQNSKDCERPHSREREATCRFKSHLNGFHTVHTKAEPSENPALSNRRPKAGKRARGKKSKSNFGGPKLSQRLSLIYKPGTQQYKTLQSAQPLQYSLETVMASQGQAEPDNPDRKGCLPVEAKWNSYTLNPQPWMLPCRLWRGFPPLDQH